MLPADLLRPGDILGGRYRVVRPVAAGGMGAVWQAADPVLGRTVAVKALMPGLLGDPSFKTRFHIEARMLAAVDHPGVVDVYDYGECQLANGNTVAFLVMAYVDGMPLSRWLAASGRLTVEQTTSVVAQAAEALHAAHIRGIVHRDVKPANLMIDRYGTVVLVDFGIALATGVSTPSGDILLATPLYMAPEQVTQRPLSAATDVYALGAVMYHCLAGRPPFIGDSPSTIAMQHAHARPPPLPPDVPQPVQVLVFQSLAKDPAARPPSAAFAAAARAAARADTLRPATAVTADLAGTTLRLPAATSSRRPGNRRAPVAAGILVAAGVAVTAAVAATVLGVPVDTLPPVPANPVQTSEPAPTVPAGQPAFGGGGQASPGQEVTASQPERSSRSVPARSPTSAPAGRTPPETGSPSVPAQPALTSPTSRTTTSTATTPAGTPGSPTRSTTTPAPSPTRSTSPQTDGERQPR